MEKLEKHIKQRLEERKIPPSEAAWEKVASSIEVESKKSIRGVYWYAIAASVIGLLISAVVYFNSENQTEQTNTIVEVEKTDEKQSDEIDQTSIVASSNKEKNLPVAKEIGAIQPAINFNEENTTTTDRDVAVMEPVFKEEKTVLDSFASTKPEDVIIDKKVEEVLTTVLDLESRASQVTDAELDSLLRNAQQEILKERLFKQDGKVDAMALLTEVEDELDESFRDKIFKKLKEGLFKARTAVAQRNH